MHLNCEPILLHILEQPQPPDPPKPPYPPTPPNPPEAPKTTQPTEPIELPHTAMAYYNYTYFPILATYMARA